VGQIKSQVKLTGLEYDGAEQGLTQVLVSSSANLGAQVSKH
jgi:hypothetical protein